MKEFYTVDQVAELLQLNPVTIRRYIEGGKIKAIKVGRVWRISEANLQEFLQKK